MKKFLSFLLVTIILSCNLTGCKTSESVETLQTETTLSDNIVTTEATESSKVHETLPSETTLSDNTITTEVTQSSKIHEPLPSETVSNDNTNKTEIIETEKMLEINVFVHNSSDYFENKIDDKDRVFDSYEQFEKFINEVIEPNYVNGVFEHFYVYDENYFKDKVLFYTTIQEITGSIKYDTKHANAIKKDGIIKITLPSYRPETFTDDMAYYCLFVEINKSDISDLASYDDILFYEERTNEEYKE